MTCALITGSDTACSEKSAGCDMTRLDTLDCGPSGTSTSGWSRAADIARLVPASGVESIIDMGRSSSMLAAGKWSGSPVAVHSLTSPAATSATEAFLAAGCSSARARGSCCDASFTSAAVSSTAVSMSKRSACRSMSKRLTGESEPRAPRLVSEDKPSTPIAPK